MRSRHLFHHQKNERTIISILTAADQSTWPLAGECSCYKPGEGQRGLQGWRLSFWTHLARSGPTVQDHQETLALGIKVLLPSSHPRVKASAGGPFIPLTFSSRFCRPLGRPPRELGPRWSPLPLVLLCSRQARPQSALYCK